MPKNAECLKTKGRPTVASLRCKLMTNTCLSCTVHSCISHLGCPGAVDPVGSSGVKGPVWICEDQLELKKLSQCLTLFILRKEVRSFLTTLIGRMWLCAFLGLNSHSVSTDTHCSGPQFSHKRSETSISPVLHKFSMHEMVEIYLSKSPESCQSIHKAFASHFLLLRHWQQTLLTFYYPGNAGNTRISMYCHSNNIKLSQLMLQVSQCLDGLKELTAYNKT